MRLWPANVWCAARVMIAPCRLALRMLLEWEALRDCMGLLKGVVAFLFVTRPKATSRLARMKQESIWGLGKEMVVARARLGCQFAMTQVPGLHYQKSLVPPHAGSLTEAYAQVRLPPANTSNSNMKQVNGRKAAFYNGRLTAESYGIIK